MLIIILIQFFQALIINPFYGEKKKNKVIPISFNPFKRKRRQEIKDYNETGSYYIVKKESFLKHNNRFGKKNKNFVSDFHSIFEIDTFEDYKYIKELLKTSIPKKYNIFLPKKPL